MSASADLERLYELLARLEQAVGGKRVLDDCHGRMAWPQRGVYFVFEPGEYRGNAASGQRVARVGTQALKAGSKATLWQRLHTHRGHGDGGGNHRGSVFRLHVGAALIQRHGWRARYSTWGQGSSAPREARASEQDLEVLVSEHIRAMSVLWVAVEDEPGPDSDRGYLERNTIGLLSCAGKRADLPSSAWLGRHSPNEAIRRSGLWNVNHTDEQYDPAFLDVLEQYVGNILEA